MQQVCTKCAASVHGDGGDGGDGGAAMVATVATVQAPPPPQAKPARLPPRVPGNAARQPPAKGYLPGNP